jgi:hypothetical protein
MASSSDTECRRELPELTSYSTAYIRNEDTLDNGPWVRFDDHLSALEKEKAEREAVESDLRVSKVGEAFGKVATKERDLERHKAQEAEKKLAQVRVLFDAFFASLSPANQRRVRAAADKSTQEEATQ